MVTSTLSVGHLQYSLPPAKPAAAGLLPASIEGCIVKALPMSRFSFSAGCVAKDVQGKLKPRAAQGQSG
jgi:hypothetical protein